MFKKTFLRFAKSALFALLILNEVIPGQNLIYDMSHVTFNHVFAGGK